MTEAGLIFLHDLTKHQALSVEKAAAYCGVDDWSEFEQVVRAQIDGTLAAIPLHGLTQSVGDAIGVAVLMGAHLERLGLLRRVS